MILKVLILSLLFQLGYANTKPNFLKYQSSILKHKDSSYILKPYCPVNFKDGTFLALYLNITSGKSYKVKLRGGVSVQQNSIREIQGTIGQPLLRLSETNWIGIVEKLYNPYYKYIFTRSNNYALNWYQTTDTMYTGSKLIPSNSYVGEDVSAFWDGSKYIILFRDSTTQNNLRRTLAITTTTDFKTFTDRKPLLTNHNFNNPNSIFYRKSVYQASGFKEGNNYWMIANYFQHRVDMKENNPDATGNEHTLMPYLYYSANGTDWKICNDSLPIIRSSKKQVVGYPTVVRSYIYVYCIENDGPHNNAFPQRMWEVNLYALEIKEGLNSYKY